MNADFEKRCVESEERGFSSAFWRLIDHETDVSGFVAYGFYKLYKFSEIEKNRISSRGDPSLDSFGLSPRLADGFKVQADAFLEKANSNLSTAAAVSAQSKQLKEIGRTTRKKNFWWNVSASATATGLLAFLPISVGLLYPDFRQSVGLWIIDSVASVSIDKPAQVVNLFVEQMSHHEQRDYVENIIRQSVEQAANPTFVLGAVVDNLDHRPAKDRVILQHVQEALKRSESPFEIAEEIYLQEIEAAAASPFDESDLDQDATPNFEAPVPELRPLN